MGKIAVTRIAELRKKVGMTQSQLATRLDVDISTVRNLERNRTGVEQIERFIRLCEVLKCLPTELIDYKSVEDGDFADPW
jgi:transcriptional regulator with XRE-family HTH domain